MNFWRDRISSGEIRRVIDRDDRTDAEIARLQKEGVRVLTRRHIESYLPDDDVLTRLCQTLGDAARASDLLEAKTTALKSSVAAGGPAYDFKRIEGDVYLAAKRSFPAGSRGQNIGQ